VAFYTATVSTDGSGDGTNLDSLGNCKWNGDFSGLLMAVKFDFASATDAGADTTLTEPVGLGRTIGTVSNSKTDTTMYPRVLETDTLGASIGTYTQMVVDSHNLKVTIAQGGATVTDAVKVIVQVLEGC
jgi:hypothetical protein